MLNVGFVVGEISEDTGANWNQFCAWHPDWPTNDIQVFDDRNTNQRQSALIRIPSGQWRDYATDFHGLRPGIKFGWTWSPVWFHWQNGPALDGDCGHFHHHQQRDQLFFQLGFLLLHERHGDRRQRCRRALFLCFGLSRGTITDSTAQSRPARKIARRFATTRSGCKANACGISMICNYSQL